MKQNRSAGTWSQIALLVLASMTAYAEPATPESESAASLRKRYADLSAQLEQSPIQKGLYLESVETSHASRGDVYGVVDYPFTTVSASLTSPADWCQALILHLNVKYCQASVHNQGAVLSVAIGKKIDQPLSETHRVEFAYEVSSPEADYMKVDLDARRGPLGTRDYQIALELIGLEDDRVFLHVRYSYTYGLMARLAMRVYLATSGHGKVGFTMVGGENGGPPHFVGGVRGALERNIMRYYLAIDAYLGALATPAPLRFDDSLERWFAATERYSTQLHEVDHDSYVTMKRREYLRQQTPPSAIAP